jgi:Ca2+-binding RTX toxin-like protein
MRFFGLGGNDTLLAGASARRPDVGLYEQFFLYGGDGDDVLKDNAHGAQIAGTNAPATLDGGGGNDTLAGGEAAYGQNGDDDVTDAHVAYGGNGNDRIAGEGTKFGGRGDDVLVAGTYGNVMFGGAGDDLIVGNDQANVMFGQAGNDTLRGGGGDDRMFGNEGDDSLDGGDGDDVLYGGGQPGDAFVDSAGNDLNVRSEFDRVRRLIRVIVRQV